MTFLIGSYRDNTITGLNDLAFGVALNLGGQARNRFFSGFGLDMGASVLRIGTTSDGSNESSTMEVTPCAYISIKAHFLIMLKTKGRKVGLEFILATPVIMGNMKYNYRYSSAMSSTWVNYNSFTLWSGIHFHINIVFGL